MTKEIEHGCMGEEGSPDEHVRKCKVHGWHGHLYPCEEYSENLLKELEELRKNNKNICGISNKWYLQTRVDINRRNRKY